MKNPEDDWAHGPRFEAPPHHPDSHPPFEEEVDHREDSPEFAAIRRIELLGRLHHMAFRSLFLKGGLPPAQTGAMKVIIRYPGLSQRELADKLHIQRATATVMLQKMEKAGFIDRRADQGDQRIFRIYPTEAALTMDTENQKRVSAYFTRCFADIPQEKLDAMTQVMTKLEENLRDIIDENPDPTNKE